VRGGDIGNNLWRSTGVSRSFQEVLGKSHYGKTLERLNAFDGSSLE